MENWGSVREFVSRRLDQIEAIDERDKKYVKFNIELDALTNRRAELISKILRMSRTALCAEIVSSALIDIEADLGLDPSDLDSEYSKSVFSILSQSTIGDVKGE